MRAAVNYNWVKLLQLFIIQMSLHLNIRREEDFHILLYFLKGFDNSNNNLIFRKETIYFLRLKLRSVELLHHFMVLTFLIFQLGTKAKIAATSTLRAKSTDHHQRNLRRKLIVSVSTNWGSTLQKPLVTITTIIGGGMTVKTNTTIARIAIGRWLPWKQVMVPS